MSGATGTSTSIYQVNPGDDIWDSSTPVSDVGSPKVLAVELGVPLKATPLPIVPIGPIILLPTLQPMPFKTLIAPNTSILFSGSVGYVGIHYPLSIAGVKAMGRTNSSSFYYPLIMQDNRYLLWGWDGGPSDMTTRGKQIFLNSVIILLQ